MTALNETAPDFSLPATDATMHGPGGSAATVIVFTCNHCPYAIAWHERLIDLARDYADRDVRVLAVNPNDADSHPRDSFEAMTARVANGEFDGTPYLRDESQEVARAYEAQTTPHVFVLDRDRVVRYRGAPDGDYDDPNERAGFVRDALDSVLAGEEPKSAETPPVGCSIKWKP